MFMTAMQPKTMSPPPGALESLFREHHELVVQAAHRVTGSAADAEDVLQTVFLRLLGREQGLDLSPNPKSYFYRAAINAGLDIVRSRAGSKSVAIEDLEPDSLEHPDRDPETEQLNRELDRRIRQSVAKLNRTAAEIFVLRFFEGCDNDEIARLLGMSKMVVAVLLHRARARVRTELGQYLEKSHEKQ